MRRKFEYLEIKAVHQKLQETWPLWAFNNLLHQLNLSYLQSALLIVSSVLHFTALQSQEHINGYSSCQQYSNECSEMKSKKYGRASKNK